MKSRRSFLALVGAAPPAVAASLSSEALVVIPKPEVNLYSHVRIPALHASFRNYDPDPFHTAADLNAFHSHVNMMAEQINRLTDAVFGEKECQQ